MKTGTKIGWLCVAVSIMLSIWVIVGQQGKAADHTDADGFSVDENGYLIAYPSVESVSIPSTVDGISVVGVSEGLFSGDSAVQTIVIGDSVEDLGTGFTDCANLKGIYVGAGVKSLSAGMFEGDNSLVYVSIDAANPYYMSVNGDIYNAVGTSLLIEAPGKYGEGAADGGNAGDGEPEGDVLSADGGTEDITDEDDGETEEDEIIEDGLLSVYSSASGQITLDFNGDVSNKTFLVFRSETADGNFRPIVKPIRGTVQYTDKGLSSGKEYYYYIQEVFALNGAVMRGDESSVIGTVAM